MTDRIKDGGPAFPTEPRGPAHGRNYDGMTLRDWFAGQALGAMNLGIDPDENAEWAYKIADAMLEARK